MKVAWSRVLSGVEEAGVSVTVSVRVCPTASVSGVKALAERPVWSVSVSATVSGTFPTLENVSVSATPVPGVVPSDVGLPVTVTASIAGTVNVTVWVFVMAELVVLVALTVNGRTVPGAESVWPVFGCK